MKLPFFSKINKNQEVFLGLFLKESQGVAILMVKEFDVIKIREKIKFNYTNSWENLTEDIDEVLYRIEKNHQVQISKTIFFVYSHLVDEKTNDIKKPYINKIKDLVKNLELEAMGYIECFEAVSFYLEKREEASLTAVVLELDKKQLSLFVYKGGKVDFKNIIARTDNIIDDFILAVDGLKEKKLLPSRVIIYDSDNIDDAAVKIIGHKWNNDYFVQMPKINILKEDEVIDGLVQVFSGQTKTRVEEHVPVANQSFGFVVGEDIKEENIEETFPKEEKIKNKFNFNFLLRLPKLKIPQISLSFFKGKTAILIGILFIFLSLFLNEYFFHKAKITVYLPSQTIEKKIVKTIDYKIASAEASFTETISTTGKKEIGDRAKGTITVHSFDDKEKIFAKGTIVESASIKFLLDNEIKVASSSIAADGSAKLPGKSNVTITSQSIGPEGNLSKNSRFKIDDLSTTIYFAINENSFSGGSKKEIKTVSSNDIENLKKNILEKAEKSFKTPNLSKNNEVLSDLSEFKFNNEEYSKEIGEEADKITLNAKVGSIYYSYDKSELTDILIKELKKEVKNNYSINKGNLNFKIIDVEINKSKLDLTINSTAKAIPKFNIDEALNKVIGKNQNKLESIFKSEFKIQGYDVVINQPLPLLNKFLPLFKRNISLTISSL